MNNFETFSFFSQQIPSNSFVESDVESMLSIKLEKINTYFNENEPKTIENIIKAYDNYRDCNNFSDLVCPLCKHKCLVFHKIYERNLTYFIDGELKNIKINIIVCKCKHCEKAHNKQKYHALLPEFILPYAIYEASTIITAINDYLQKKKLDKILERLQITHKLFYDWLKKLKVYVLPSSVILKTINDINKVISEIKKSNTLFLKEFYDIYEHPFFLFKITCVPLCIIP